MDENMNEDGTATSQIIEAARARKGAKLIDVAQFCDDSGPVPMLAVPVAGGGVEMNSILDEVKAWREDRRERPDRREGTAQLGTLDSFTDHARRFMDQDSTVWISPDARAPRFTAILDYHEAVNLPEPSTPMLPAKAGDAPAEMIHEVARVALPRFGRHRGVFVPAFSPEWELWTKANERPILQGEFAKLIELGSANIVDVIDLPTDDKGAPQVQKLSAWYHRRFGSKFEVGDFFASSGRMLEMAEGLIATVEEKIGEVESRSGGSKAVVFESATKTTVQIPTAFLLQLPIFRGGDMIEIPVRLRMATRVTGDTKRLEWTISLWNPAAAVARDVEDMAETIRQRTKLPTFTGIPEA